MPSLLMRSATGRCRGGKLAEVRVPHGMLGLRLPLAREVPVEGRLDAGSLASPMPGHPHEVGWLHRFDPLDALEDDADSRRALRTMDNCPAPSVQLHRAPQPMNLNDVADSQIGGLRHALPSFVRVAGTVAVQAAAGLLSAHYPQRFM